MSDFLPYGRQSLSAADIEAVVGVLRSDFLTTGPAVDAFEAELAAFTGARDAVVVNSATAALHLGVAAEMLTPKCVVIVPSITFVATANCVAYCGAKVIFADVDPLSGLMTSQTFDDAVAYIDRHMPGYRFAGCIPVHLAGHAVDLSHIAKVCQQRGAFLIEDASHAIGSVGPQGRVGSCRVSNLSVFSFHPVKTMTTGEGGALTLNDPELARRLRRMRSHGVERDPSRFIGFGYEGEGNEGPWVYEMQELGFNYRLPDINCALGRSQLRQMPHFAERRKALVKAYRSALYEADLPVHNYTGFPGSEPVPHLFQINIDFKAAGLTRTQVMQGLRDKGIGSQVHYIPVHRQPYWLTHQAGERHMPGSDKFYHNSLSLPLYAEMSDEDPVRVVNALSEIIRGN